MKKIKASAIVISYNNAYNLRQCLDSLINQNFDANFIDLEIIVVDSGSIDNSLEILRSYRNNARIIRKGEHLRGHLGPAKARNLGARNAREDILIFCDGDCIPFPNWIDTMIVSFKNPQIDCVIGTREPDVRQGIGSFVRGYDFILYSNKFSILEPVVINKTVLRKGVPFVTLAGNNFAIKRKVWNNLGGMKTIFKRPAGEDIMLEVDLLKNGYNILFNPKSKVTHVHPLSLVQLFKKVLLRSESAYLLGKYSGNFINWRHFAKRGNIHDLKKFSLSILLVILILIIVSLLKIPSLLIPAVLFPTILLTVAYRRVKLNRRLKRILDSKGKKYGRAYEMSLFQLFFFDQIRFLLKSMGSINFLRCYLLNYWKDAIYKKIIKY